MSSMQARHFLAPALIGALLGIAIGCAPYVYVPASAPGPPPAPPATEVNVTFFYDALAPYGEWLWLSPEGWVWIPHTVPIGWRPYTYGHWVYSELGWYWVSDWDWGWAPFHYGRWSYHRHHGWIWLPGRVWAPAWVAWRSGDGWIGWAPLPPGVNWRVGVGLDLGGVDLNVSISSFGWCFVEEPRFLDTRIHRYVAPPARNVTLTRITHDVTHYTEVNHQVAVRSIEAERMQRVVGRPITPAPIQDLPQPPATRSERVDREGIRVYRPPVAQTPSAREPSPPQAAPEARESRADYERQVRDLERWAQEQQEKLDQTQRRETRQPPEGVPPQEVRERQEAEQKALRDQVKQQREVLDNREKQRQDSAAERKSSTRKERTPVKPKREKPKPPAG